MSPKKPLKLAILTTFPPPGGGRASGDIVGTYVSNSDPWGCPGARVITIFGSYVDPRFPNTGYFELYVGI